MLNKCCAMACVSRLLVLTVITVQVSAESCAFTSASSLLQSNKVLERIDEVSPADAVELVSTTRTDWLAGGRLRTGSCDALGKMECRHDTGCGWSETGNRCHIRVAWVHIPKTGGSFGTTLVHYANSSLPKTAHMPTGRNQSDPEDRTTEGSQGEWNFFKFKYPYEQWFQGVFWHDDNNPANHVAVDTQPVGSYSDWKGNFFGIFRQPEHRILSAFYHFMHGKGDLLEYAHEIQGQTASMMSMGKKAVSKIKCEFREDSHIHCPIAKVTKPDVRLAIERLKGFAFIGLLEQYDLSVCLFHRMFQSECLAVEFINMRPHISSALETKDKKSEDLALLMNHQDPFDGPLYAAAEHIFWENVRKYDARPTTCMETCSSVAHVFRGMHE